MYALSLLNAAAIGEIKQELTGLAFAEGRETAQGIAAEGKKNAQALKDDPRARARRSRAAGHPGWARRAAPSRAAGPARGRPGRLAGASSPARSHGAAERSACDSASMVAWPSRATRRTMRRSGGSSKVELSTWALVVRSMSVTSSGRSSISRMMSTASGWTKAVSSIVGTSSPSA